MDLLVANHHRPQLAFAVPVDGLGPRQALTRVLPASITGLPIDDREADSSDTGTWPDSVEVFTS